MTPKQIAGYLKVRRARSRDALRGDPLGGITFNDGYNVPTFGITKAAYDAISRAMHDEYGMAEPSHLTAAHVKEALRNQEARTGRPIGEQKASERHHATKKSPAQLQREIDEALASRSDTSGSGKATIVTKQANGSLKAIQVPISTLVSTMADLGFEHTGYNNNPRQRAELQGAPKFRGVNGPMWGGSESAPLRYETPEAYRTLSHSTKARRATGSRAHATKKTDRSKTGLPVRDDVTEVKYHRPPTTSEIRFGHGATHYRTFPVEEAVFPGTRVLKKWIVADDGLRYYR